MRHNAIQANGKDFPLCVENVGEALTNVQYFSNIQINVRENSSCGAVKEQRHRNSTEGLRSTSAPILRKPSVKLVLFYRVIDPDTQTRRIFPIHRNGRCFLYKTRRTPNKANNVRDELSRYVPIISCVL